MSPSFKKISDFKLNKNGTIIKSKHKIMAEPTEKIKSFILSDMRASLSWGYFQNEILTLLLTELFFQENLEN